MAVYFVLREKWTEVAYILIHGLWPILWVDGQGLERNMIGKLMTIKLWRGIWMDFSQWTKKIKKKKKICVSWVNAYQRVLSSLEAMSILTNFYELHVISAVHILVKYIHTHTVDKGLSSLLIWQYRIFYMKINLISLASPFYNGETNPLRIFRDSLGNLNVTLS